MGSAPDAASEKLSVQMERFTNLSSEITKILSELDREVKESMDQLQGIRSAVDFKKKELKTLHDIDVSATALERLIEDHRLQREDLERVMESQRNAWEEEKARRVEEERQYLENLQIQRQREQEEHRQMLAAERLAAQQKLEEELQEVRQRNLEKQKALERDFMAREQVLNEKELEWGRLIQELEQFVAKLTMRAQSRKDPSALGGEPAQGSFGIPS
jgi:chromosome segregation ATPase